MCCMVFLLVFGVLGNRGVSAAVDSYTKLLIHGDSISDVTVKTVTTNGDVFVSNAGKTVTANGNAQIDTAQGKFGGVSGLFDGAGNYLTVPDSDDWNFGSGDFTVDFWVRWNILPTTGQFQAFFSQEDPGETAFYLGLDNNGGTMKLYFSSHKTVGYFDLYSCALSLSTGTWYHIAIVRNGDNYVLYLDGVNVGTMTSNGTLLDEPGTFNIGAYDNGVGGIRFGLNGWLDELRVTKGIARWTSDFTPTTDVYTSDNCTKLLLHFNGSDSSTSFIDSSRDHFKGKAISFDGTGDYLSLADSDDWNLGSGAFTIDFWVRWNSASNFIMGQVIGDSRWHLYVHPSSGGIALYSMLNGSTNQDVNWTVYGTTRNLNQWYHFAFVRIDNGNTAASWRAFQDGVSQTLTLNTGAWNGPMMDSDQNLLIGSFGGISDFFDGCTDEIRISKGIGRWTSDFCPPNAPYGIEDTTSPTVSSTSPTSNATGVAVDSTISATFSEDMDSFTINTSTFTLSDSDGNNISGTVSSGFCNKTATFTPSSNLAYSTTYTAMITTGAKDMGENPLTSAYLWTFTTVSDPNISPTCYQFVTKWGSQGTGDGQFNFPNGLAIDSAENIYVADTSNHRIQKFNSSGSFIIEWGSYGTGDGQFNEPTEVAVDASGNVYVADLSNHRIQKFSSNGTFTTKWGSYGTGDGQFNRPTGVAVDSSGDVYVADAYNNRIQKFSSSGTFITKWGTSGTGDGQFNSPVGVVVDSTGNVYVADYNNQRIQKFSSCGTFITKWGSIGTGDGQFNNPYGVAVDAASGDVYVGDSDNNRVQKFSSSGTFITKWGTSGSGDGQFISANDVAIDASGNVYVTDHNNHRIQKFSPCEAVTPTPTVTATPTPSPVPTSTATPTETECYQFVNKWGVARHRRRSV